MNPTDIPSPVSYDLLTGSKPRTVLLDANAISRLADCPYSALVCERLTASGARVHLSLDVFQEILCAGHSTIANPDRLSELIVPLRRLLPILYGFPFAAELLGQWAWRQDVPRTFPQATAALRETISAMDVPQSVIDSAYKQTQEHRKRLDETGRTARARYSQSPDASLPRPTFAATVRGALKPSLLREVRMDLLRLARDHGHSIRPRDLRLLRTPCLQYFVLGYAYRAHVDALAPNNKVIKSHPGHNDISQLPLLPLCDVVVTDDEEFQKAACIVRDFLGHSKPWIGSYGDLQGYLLTA